MIINIIISLIIGFILGRIKYTPKINKITTMRKNINNKNWLIDKYNKLMQHEKDNNHFFKFSCSAFFVGDTTAKYNLKVYNQRTIKLFKRRRFIERRIKNISPNYYIKYIGKITNEELITIRIKNYIFVLCQEKL